MNQTFWGLSADLTAETSDQVYGFTPYRMALPLLYLFNGELTRRWFAALNDFRSKLGDSSG